MRILVACEESQAVCIAMRRLGHEAYSCDLQPCSGGHPEWHLQVDALEMLKIQWDIIIAHPPCTHLASSGAAWFEEKRANGMQQAAIEFFLKFIDADCAHIAVENPIGIMSTCYRKPDQIIQPWMFGHPEKKATCLWLKGLPPLRPTNDVSEYMKTLPKNQQERLHYLSPSPERAKLRSKTFPGIAQAMAEQWAGPCGKE
ncbi:MAG TPA: hypothetical protein H9811_09120 [Candidatus Gemmiger excrementigallinarum]|uniref:DNA cytosine methyltransferase n=1 Tax=Candidatus Gemmiger excrementigallinarum TaxID=2838609 RepID=A0A9D2ESQ1_9FIRM|nr:hypothetical protein [Candidatus Gemmiger excrementigallinarum]